MLFDKPSNYPSSDYRSCNFKGNWTTHFINSYIDSVTAEGVFKSMESFFDRKTEHLPSCLYKFMPPTIYTLTSVLQSTVHLSSPQIFNDPFDSFMGVNEDEFVKMFILQELKELGYVEKKRSEKSGTKDKLTNDEYWKIYYSRCEGDKNYRGKSFTSTYLQVLETKSKKFKEIWDKLYYNSLDDYLAKIKYLRDVHYRISCFSNFDDEDELMENTTMWSHYADSHKGFCVKYSMDFDNLMFKEMLMCGLFPVKYSSRIQNITTNQLLSMRETDDKFDVSSEIKKKTLKSLLTKSRFWNYEKEWRLILSQNDCCLLDENNIPFSKIEAIYLGCRIDKSIAELLLKIGDDSGFKVFQTEQSKDKFSLFSYQLGISDEASSAFRRKLRNIDAIDNEKERIAFQKFLCDNYLL